MRKAVIFCILLFLITGMVSASGVVPAERMVRNTTVIAPVATTAPPADSGLVQSIFSPVARYIPGMATPTPAPAPTSAILPVTVTGSTGTNAPALSGGIPPSQSNRLHSPRSAGRC